MSTMFVLDTQDKKILRALQKKTYNMRTLAIQTGISRTTAIYRLERLAKHKLVEEIEAPGKQRVWRLKRRNAISSKHLFFYQGDDILNAYALPIKEIQKKTTMYTIEGLKHSKLATIRATMKEEYQSMSIQAHNTYHKRDIIIKCICHGDSLQTLLEQSTSMLHSRKKHHTIVRSLPYLPLKGPCAYLFMPHCVIMFNEAREHAIAIKDTDMAKMLYGTVALLFELLELADNVKKVNLKQLIERTLTKLEDLDTVSN